jgi:hypothetical protein
MTPCKNTKCDHFETYEYSNGNLKFPFVRDSKQDYSATRAGDKMHVVRSGVILCPLCNQFKHFDLCTAEKPKKKKKGK